MIRRHDGVVRRDGAFFFFLFSFLTRAAAYHRVDKYLYLETNVGIYPQLYRSYIHSARGKKEGKGWMELKPTQFSNSKLDLPHLNSLQFLLPQTPRLKRLQMSKNRIV